MTSLSPATTTAPRSIGTPSSVSAELLSGAPRLLHLSTLTLVALVAAFFVWAAFARLEQVTIGQGKVVPASKTQLVQSLEGGIVKAIHASEGMLVEKGDLLLQIDPTGFGSDLDQVREKLIGLGAKRARLLAEANGTALAFPPELQAAHPDITARQRAEYEARRAEHMHTLSAIDERALQRRQEVIENEAKAATLEQSLELARTELELTEPLVAKGAAAKVEVIRLKSRVAEIEGSLAAARLAIPRLKSAIAEAEMDRQQQATAFRTAALKDLNEIDIELAALGQAVKADADKVARTDLRAPARGIVQRLHVTTLGQVVKPGQDIVEIVPIDDTLLVEAKVATRDVAFLTPGQDAVVKITAYEFGIYGSLKGRLERISADAITTDKGDSYYSIEIRTDLAYLEKDGRRLPIIPGMVAEVDIVTGAKSVLHYLINPLTRLRAQAMRER
jgi:adhesin transport system membrane fusion protein